MSVGEQPRELTFYFDYISHNAYLAWTQLSKLGERHNLIIKPIPVLFAGFLKEFGQLGPAEIPPKAHWMTKDVIRKAKLLDIPLQPPASHPFNPLLALRVTCQLIGKPKQNQVIDSLFKAAWARSQDISSTEIVAEVINQIGLDSDRLIADSQSVEVKQILIDNTESALRSGVFGVPSMVINDEVFWGYDDFLYLEHFLNNKALIGPEELSAWTKVQPSVQRQRR